MRTDVRVEAFAARGASYGKCFKEQVGNDGGDTAVAAVFCLQGEGAA